MSGPWFRPYGRFSYRPITEEGRLVLVSMALIAIPAGIAWLSYADSRPSFATVAGAIAVLSAIIGHGIVFWKMDRGYRSR